MKQNNDDELDGIKDNNNVINATANQGGGGVIKGAWVLQQMWHRNGTRCPRGTVPIRRSTMDDVLRAKSLFDFGKKQHRTSFNINNKNITADLASRRVDAPDVVSGNGHEVNPNDFPVQIKPPFIHQIVHVHMCIIYNILYHPNHHFDMITSVISANVSYHN